MPQVKLNQETVFQYDGVTLFPDWNEVSDEDFAKLKTATLSFDLGILESKDVKPSKDEKK